MLKGVDKMDVKKILVTGGCGFIGTNLVKELQKKYDIIVLDNLSRETAIKNKQHIEQNFPSVKIINGDIRDSHLIRDVVEHCDFIIHCAAQVAVTTSIENPTWDKEINIDGTLNILESARRAKNKPGIIYFSTNKVYGNTINSIPIKELESRYDFANEFKGKGIPETFSTDAHEHTPYGVSKYAAELYLRDYSKNFGLKTVSNRCSCMYGTQQYGTADQGWVAHFVISALLNKPITIYGNGKQIRDLLFMDDINNLILNQIENIDEINGEVFNIGGGPSNTVSILELLNQIKEKQNLPKISHSEWRLADQKVFYCDVSKAKRVLNWEPTVSAKEGIDRLYEWAKAALKNENKFNLN